MKIIVTRQGDTYLAYVVERTEIWGVGKSSDGAIGNLVSSHAGVFKIEVESE